MKCQKCGAELSAGTKFCHACGEKVADQLESVEASPVFQHDLSKVWPEWKIERVLGKGSFGLVYQAIRQDNNVISRSAIKVISIPQDASEVDSLRSEGLTVDDSRTYYQGIVNDFVNEIQLMESFKGTEHIVSVEDYKVVDKEEEIGWDIYIRMELLTPFSSYLMQNQMSEEQVIQLGIDICEALEKCNQRNIIHRDIKPENIFVNDFGSYKLGDFGIARKMENMTSGMSQKGTYNYMAPEVFRGTQYDARVDIYSLGLMLYRLMNANHLPFLDTEQQLKDPNERKKALDRRLSGEVLPLPCKASDGFANIILKACAYDESIRFASATELKQALQDQKAGVYKTVALNFDKTTPMVNAGVAKSQAQQQTATPEFGKKKKSKAPLIIILILLLALVGVGVWFFLLRDQGEKETSGKKAESKVETVDKKDTEESKEEKEKLEDDEAYSKSENRQIDKVIKAADALADEGDYTGALDVVKNGLLTYPSSEKLKIKIAEYEDALAQQYKQNKLSEAKAMADLNKYEDAIALLVTELAKNDDADYRSAYDNYSNTYAEKILEKTYNMTLDKDYDRAIQTVEEGLTIVPDNTQLLAALENYQNQKIEDIRVQALSEAESYAANEDYLSAREVVKEALAIVGRDQALTEAASLYEEAYVQKVLLQVEQLIANQDVELAKLLLDESLEELPNNAELISNREEMELYGSVPLNTLTKYNWYSWKEWNEGTPADKDGNDYSSLTNNYCIISPNYSNTYVEYKVDEQYSTISLKLVPYEGFSQNSINWFELYVDGELRYTIPSITQKDGVIELKDIDISDAEYIKMYIKSNRSDSSNRMMLYDVVLNRIPGYERRNDNSYTALNTLNTISYSGWSWNNKRPYDMLGADYSKVRNYAILSDNNSYAEYSLDKKYSTISMNIAPYLKNSSSKNGLVYLYADDVLIYTSPSVSYKTSRFNTGELDISGASFLKIVVDGYYIHTILSDVILK